MRCCNVHVCVCERGDDAQAGEFVYSVSVSPALLTYVISSCAAEVLPPLARERERPSVCSPAPRLCRSIASARTHRRALSIARSLAARSSFAYTASWCTAQCMRRCSTAAAASGAVVLSSFIKVGFTIAL